MTMTSAVHKKLISISSLRDVPIRRRVVGARRNVGRDNHAVVRGDASTETLPRLPRSPREQVTQAAEAVRRAAASNDKQLFEIEFQLPLIGATDLDDWPGGIRQQCESP